MKPTIGPRLLLGLLMATTGCYRYSPAEPSGMPAGSHVRIALTSAGTSRLRPSIGDFAIEVEGAVTSANADTLTLALTAVRRRGEVQASLWQGESIQLLKSDVDELRLRELSRKRTTGALVAVGAVGVGLVIAIAKAVGILESSGSGKGPPPVP